MARDKFVVRSTKRQIDAAIARAKQFQSDDRRVIQAEYRPMEDLIILHLDDGVIVSIPRKYLQGLEHAKPAQLSKIQIAGKGTGLRWPLIGVDHYVFGLLGHVFGTRRWMRKIGRLGGLARSKAKATAARRNGQKGGRPSLKVYERSGRSSR